MKTFKKFILENTEGFKVISKEIKINSMDKNDDPMIRYFIKKEDEEYLVCYVPLLVDKIDGSIEIDPNNYRSSWVLALWKYKPETKYHDMIKDFRGAKNKKDMLMLWQLEIQIADPRYREYLDKYEGIVKYLAQSIFDDIEEYNKKEVGKDEAATKQVFGDLYGEL